MLKSLIPCSLLSFIAFTFLVSCSTSDYKMVESKRDPQFFTQFLNPSVEVSSADRNIEKIKLLLTSDEYPIRLAIYDNGQFYYQVDELGSGYGSWVFRDGAIRLTAKRKVFDMNFYVSAAEDEGNKVVVKFFDRHGMNKYELDFRNPQKMEEDGVTPQKLREFKASIKDI